jgi:uncharacterized protein
VYRGLLENRVLICCLAAWLIAQGLKVPIDWIRTKKIHWGLLFTAGGMPSSHSAMMTAATLAIGLFHGFDNPLFGLAVGISMIVIYDATGVRRQAGMQAKKINILIDEIFQGHPINEKQLKEVLGHTPMEVTWGVALGLVIPILVWVLWRPI